MLPSFLKLATLKHYLVIAAFFVGLIGSVGALLAALPAGTSLATLLVSLAPIAVFAGSHIVSFFQNPPQDPAEALADGEAAVPDKTAAKVAGIAGLFALMLLASGCLSSAPTVPVTPANSAQITTCENTATFHNDLVIGDFVFSGAAGTLGAVGAVASDSTAKTDAAIGAAIAGGAAVLTSSLIALTTSNYANNGCGSVVGALPVAAPAPAGAQ